ncbi:MAG: iron ABC transporter permease, partial [Anaerolineales bacterium]|nr:iron ABC transporter permease [Anaerolineales bacterium]
PSLLLWFLPLTFLVLFYFYPLGSILELSFSRAEGGILAGLWNSISSPTVRNALGFTFKQAFYSTLLTLLVGLPGAYLFGRHTFRGKKILRALTGVPFVMPTLVVAAGFYALLGPNGWVNATLMQVFQLDAPPIQFVNTFAAILTAHVFYNTTIVLRLVGDYWSRLDPRLESAARALGADRWRTLREISLPLITPAIAAAALLVFIFDFTSFGVILILGGPQFSTLEVEIYYQTISLFNLPLAATLSLLQVGFTLVLTIAYTRITAGLSQPVNLSSAKTTQGPIMSQKGKLIAGTFILVLLVFLISPLAALAGRSFTPLGAGEGTGSIFTLAFYQALALNPQESLFYVPPTTALGVSFGYGLITVVLALVLGLPAAWALAKKNLTILDRILDPVLMLPLGTSAVTLGLGFLMALDQPPLDLRASPLLVPIAHTLVAFPFVVRSLTPALSSIQPNLRQAAAVLGASPGQVFRYIDLPLIGRALLVAASFAFMISIGEFGASALIVRPEYPTVPIVIFRLLSRPGALNYGQAMALSTILMVVTLGGMLLMEHFRLGEVGEF